MAKDLKAPKWADNALLDKMAERTSALVTNVKEESGPALLRKIDIIGAESQKLMTQANDSMQQSVSALLTGLDGKSPTAEKLLELRSKMDEINPHSLHNAWWFSWMPKGIKRKAVSKFVHRYQPMNTHVNSILTGLREGKDDLLESSIELEHQYGEIQRAQQEIQKEIYIGEMFINQIEDLESKVEESDVQEKTKLSTVKNKAARRIRDLRTKEQAAVQFFISIDQTVASNELLSEQIDSALSVGPMVMTNALRIQAALARQDTVKNAVSQFQEGLGDMMAQNAAAVNQAAEEIGDLYNNPVVALEKMEEGFDSLMQAVATANKTMEESTIAARESSARLAEMTAELVPVAEGLHDASEERKKASLNTDEAAVVADMVNNASGSDDGNTV